MTDPSTSDRTLRDSPNRGLTAPRQERSRQVADRVIDATIRLLADRTFNEIGNLDTCTHADVSPSSIYARFRTKAAILQALQDGYAHDLLAFQDDMQRVFLDADDRRENARTVGTTFRMMESRIPEVAPHLGRKEIRGLFVAVQTAGC